MSCTPYRSSALPGDEQHISHPSTLGKRDLSTERATLDDLRTNDTHFNKQGGLSVKTLASRFQGSNYNDRPKSQLGTSNIQTLLHNKLKFSGEDFILKEGKNKLEHRTFESNRDEVVSELMDHAWQNTHSKIALKNNSAHSHITHICEDEACTKEISGREYAQSRSRLWKNKLTTQEQERIHCVSGVASRADWIDNRDKSIVVEGTTNMRGQHNVKLVERSEVLGVKDFEDYEQPKMENIEFETRNVNCLKSRRISSSNRTRSWSKFLHGKEKKLIQNDGLTLGDCPNSSTYINKKENSSAGDDITLFRDEERKGSICHEYENLVSQELSYPTKFLSKTDAVAYNDMKEASIPSLENSKEKAGPGTLQHFKIERNKPKFNFWKNHPRVGRRSPKLQNFASEDSESDDLKGRVEANNGNKAAKAQDLKKSPKLCGDKTTHSIQVCNHYPRRGHRALPVASAEPLFQMISHVKPNSNPSTLKSTSPEIHTIKQCKVFDAKECNDMTAFEENEMERSSPKGAFRERILKFDTGSCILVSQEKAEKENNEANIHMKGHSNPYNDGKNQIINEKNIEVKRHTNDGKEPLSQFLDKSMHPDGWDTNRSALNSTEKCIYYQNKDFFHLKSKDMPEGKQEPPMNIKTINGIACDHSCTIRNKSRNEVARDETAKNMHIHVKPSTTRMKKMRQYNKTVKKSVSSTFVPTENSKFTKQHLNLSTEAIHNFHMTPSSTDTTATETTLDEMSGNPPLLSPQGQKKISNTPTETITEEKCDTRESSTVDISMVSIKEVKRRLWGPDEKLRCQKDDFNVRVDASTNNSIFKTRFHRAAEVSQKNKAIEVSLPSEFPFKNRDCADNTPTSFSCNQDMEGSRKISNEQLGGKNTESPQTHTQGSCALNFSKCGARSFYSNPRHVTVLPHERKGISSIAYKHQQENKSRYFSNEESRSISTLVTKINLIKREDESTALEVIDSILASECKTSGAKQELRAKAHKHVNNFTKLVTKINAVKRDDASAALAVIDSIIESECKVLGIAQPVQNSKPWNRPKLIEKRLHDEYSSCRNEKDPEDIELTSEEEDDSNSDDSTVSSITNPTYQSGFGDMRMKNRKQTLSDLVTRNLSSSRKPFRLSAFLSNNVAIAEDVIAPNALSEWKESGDDQYLENRKSGHEWTALEPPPLLYRKSNQANTVEKVSHSNSSPLRSSKYSGLMRVTDNPVPAEESTAERNERLNRLPLNSFNRRSSNRDELKIIQSWTGNNGEDVGHSLRKTVKRPEVKTMISPSIITMSRLGECLDNDNVELDGRSIEQFRKQDTEEKKRRLLYPSKGPQAKGNDVTAVHENERKWKVTSSLDHCKSFRNGEDPTRILSHNNLNQSELTDHFTDSFNEVDVSISLQDRRDALDDYENTILAQKYSSVEQTYDNTS